MKILVCACSPALLGATIAHAMARRESLDTPILFVEIEKEKPSFEEVVFHELAKNTQELIELTPFITTGFVEEYIEYFAPVVRHYSPMKVTKHLRNIFTSTLHLITRSRPPPEHPPTEKIKIKSHCKRSGNFFIFLNNKTCIRYCS